MFETLWMSLMVFLVALLYSSVGHGGASGYLAILIFFAIPRAEMATSALTLNLLVAGLAWVMYLRAKHFSFRLILPFIIGSVPLAFIGGVLKVQPQLYGLALAFSLTYAAFRLVLINGNRTEARVNSPLRPLPAVAMGGAIGLLSGIVGVGGGIFLSPLLILFNWSNAKTAAATSSFFIIVNSTSGLMGRIFSGQFLTSLVIPLLLPAFLGGLLGSQLGAKHFSAKTLRALLAAALILASFKALRAGMG